MSTTEQTKDEAVREDMFAGPVKQSQTSIARLMVGGALVSPLVYIFYLWAANECLTDPKDAAQVKEFVTIMFKAFGVSLGSSPLFLNSRSLLLTYFKAKVQTQ